MMTIVVLTILMKIVVITIFQEEVSSGEGGAGMAAVKGGEVTLLHMMM